MKYPMLSLTFLPLFAAAEVGRAQGAAAEATALRSCVELANAGKSAEAAVPGQQAEALFRRRITRNSRDLDALVGAARALSQCLVPSADFMNQGELTSEAMELLDRAIKIDSSHFEARFVLASIAYRSPSFLGRGAIAAREFDELIRRHGDRADVPLLARVYQMRGTQLSREGMMDSARAVWNRGAALFPEDAELKRLAARPPAPNGEPGDEKPMPSVGGTTIIAAASAPITRADTGVAGRNAALETVQVTANSAPRRHLPSVNEVPRSQVLLTAGGAADVLQAVQMQPGATRVGEGGDVYTRGGDVGETSLLVNGGRILSLARFEGLSGSLFGAIEPVVVRSVRYSSGGFSARHGNALSGVLEIETDGRPRERSSRAGLSLVQASGTTRLPMGRHLGGWISGRVSHTGALLQTHGRADEFDGAPQSQEMIGSLIAAPNAFTELRATTIVERDAARPYITAAGWRDGFDSEGKTGAALLSGRWVSRHAPLVVKSSFAGSTRSTEWAFGVLSRTRNERSAITRLDGEYQPRDGFTIRAGVEQGAHVRNERGTVPTTASVATGAPTRALANVQTSANQFGVYAEGELERGIFLLTLGLRTDRLPGERDATVDPRLAVSAHIGEWTTRLSGGVFHQGRWRGDAAIPDAGTPSGLPATARHLVLGTERENASFLFRVEGFLKRYDDYRAFGVGPAILAASSRGVDLIAQRTAGSIRGWIGYSLLDAESRLASGEHVRSPWDVTHSATASVTKTIGDWSLGSTVRYGSGAPRTPVVGGQRLVDGRVEPVYGSSMSDRLPAYARFDARVMRYVRLPGALLTTFVEALNVTNRANVSNYTYDPTYSSREPIHSFFAKRTLVVGGELMFR